MSNYFRCTWLSVVLLTVLAHGCKPAIYSFSVVPLTITRDDTILVSWSVRGQATLLTHIDTASGDGDNEAREYKLVVHRNGKDVEQIKLVNVLPVLSSDDIDFPVMKKGDTLIAAGQKNTERWGTRFILQQVSAAGGRQISVTHEGKTAMLPADGSSSAALAGLPNSGGWRLQTLLTPAEKRDSSRIPATLRIHTIILKKK